MSRADDSFMLEDSNMSEGRISPINSALNTTADDVNLARALLADMRKGPNDDNYFSAASLMELPGYDNLTNAEKQEILIQDLRDKDRAKRAPGLRQAVPASVIGPSSAHLLSNGLSQTTTFVSTAEIKTLETINLTELKRFKRQYEARARSGDSRPYKDYVAEETMRLVDMLWSTTDWQSIYKLEKPSHDAWDVGIEKFSKYLSALFEADPTGRGVVESLMFRENKIRLDLTGGRNGRLEFIGNWNKFFEKTRHRTSNDWDINASETDLIKLVNALIRSEGFFDNPNAAPNREAKHILFESKFKTFAEVFTEIDRRFQKIEILWSEAKGLGYEVKPAQSDYSDRGADGHLRKGSRATNVGGRPCHACGIHGHTRAECRFVRDGHPNINTEFVGPNRSWVQTKIGRDYFRIGRNSLQAGKHLVDGKLLPWNKDRYRSSESEGFNPPSWEE
jgi:hypothetical protein